jgi:hypothetical protein
MIVESLGKISIWGKNVFTFAMTRRKPISGTTERAIFAVCGGTG